MRKVLGNPNSDVGMEAGGHYVVGGIKFLFEDIATLLNPNSTPSEVTMAAMFTFFKPLKAADKGYDLAGAGKKVEHAGDVRKGSEVEGASAPEKIVKNAEDVVFKQSSLDKAFSKHKNDFGSYPDGSKSSVDLFKNDVSELINTGVQKQGKYRNIEGTHIYNETTKQWTFINSDGTLNTAFKLSDKQVAYLIETGVVK
ncbi:hypothetical protein E2R51_09160 [Jeotgalibacillus sp. S-D1]|uniref:colicin D domain-containing protein n=1 Tax=Jeotgalibacillus sp. S-D1 TaxID=2552189 RepID=UPI00105A1904|nr:colicin D domain-containing protein [Jeotgalibacillus sp. S-D1]TDL32829.1 hypothetical protein E2R51_09160 [Jeotgalibacillus sp. S-D1]